LELAGRSVFPSKTISYAVWHPDIARARVTVAKGIHFSTMGHSVPRPVVGEDGVQKAQKRLELLPEETLYLVERGSLFCWKDCGLDLAHVPGLDHIPGPPMTVQQAYSELTGVEDLTLERFQVRLGAFGARNSFVLIALIGVHIPQAPWLFRHACSPTESILSVGSPVSA
jgi:tRNA-splicing endonuclease subunit Sen54